MSHESSLTNKLKVLEQRRLKRSTHKLELLRIDTYLRKQSLHSDLQEIQTQYIELLVTANMEAGNPDWEARKAVLEGDIQRLEALLKRTATLDQDMARPLDTDIGNTKREIKTLSDIEQHIRDNIDMTEAEAQHIRDLDDRAWTSLLLMVRNKY